VVEVPSRELDHLYDELSRGLTPSAVAARLASWRHEPVLRSLERLGRHARALAHKLGKGESIIFVEVDADPEVGGARGQLRLDPRRWGPLWAEMVHVVRNAVDHGFEPPDERRATGKPPRPRLRLAAFQRGDQLTVEIEDDGRGIDWEAIERAATARGLPAGNESERLAALLAPGVTTRAEVHTISGRGLGMSAVQARLRELDGTISVTTRRGGGTLWRFSFPLSALKVYPAVA
jgi:two-component system chemotaxis sensor kinase CheA